MDECGLYIKYPIIHLETTGNNGIHRTLKRLRKWHSLQPGAAPGDCKIDL